MHIEDRDIINTSVSSDTGGIRGSVEYWVRDSSRTFSAPKNWTLTTLNPNSDNISSNRKDNKVNIKTTNQTVGRDTAYVELHADLPFIDRKVFVGEAKRAPGDKSNDEIALLLATTRALELAASKLRRRVNGLMKQQNDLAAARELSKAPQKAPKARKS